MVAASDRRERASGGRTVMMLLFGPILGLAYAIALPFIGIATIASMAAAKAVKGVAQVFGGTVHFGWRPIESYLSGKKKKEAKGKKE